MKQIVLRQYQEIADQAAKLVKGYSMPQEGWVRSMRNALGMSGAQLARRLKVSRSQVAQAEKNELSRSITLKTLDNMAQAMGCRVVYMIVAESQITDLVNNRAREKATQLVNLADTHMALESQRLGESELEYEIERIQTQLVKEMPTDLWNED